jgi:5-methyltetrahydrofolate--homocysteine methyltransferase
MTITERLRICRTYFDGGMGTLLQKEGLRAGELPETWNLTHPSVLEEIHLAYMEAGANVITSNTFGANRLKLNNLDLVIRAAYDNMARAKARFGGNSDDVYLAFDMGPLGKLLRPLGDFAFEDAVDVFAESVRVAAACGFDLILIETMSDLYETKAAVLAAKENCDLPVIVTNAYDESGHLLTGADVPAAVAVLEGLGVAALGANCSLGPQQMKDIAAQYVQCASLPVVINPNAGLPQVKDGKTVFDVDADGFAACMRDIAKTGVCGLGGCCGTTPDYIRKTVAATRGLPFVPPEEKHDTVVASYTHAVSLCGVPKLIGERINPTGKKKLQAALRAHDLGYLVREAIAQQEAGAQILDVNVGLGGLDEAALLPETVEELQSVVDLPLQIDTVRPAALERALRVYNGKPLINSVNAKEESLATVLPLARKYGGVLIALTIGEDGIPATAEGRCALAKKIVDRAAACGIDKKDIVVDPLCMAVSADDNAARVTLEAIRLIRETLGVGTCLGVSNVSFALPERQDINAAFLAMALQSGLSCAIMNPCSDEMMRAYRCFCMLQGFDPHCESYISFAQTHPRTAAVSAAAPTQPADDGNALPPLMYAVAKGLQKQAAQTAKTLLQTEEPLSLINEQIVPALNLVGERFRQGSLFLPQLLMSAEAAAAAFDTVSAKLPQADGKKGTILLATVQGDVHDIGKNIVKVLLQSYGYAVLDLGKDVPPQRVLEAAKETGTKLVGLSALMTTTLDAMAETVKLLKKELPGVFVMVGGAVLTQEYADLIGADGYSKDAMGAVALADRFFACNET